MHNPQTLQHQSHIVQACCKANLFPDLLCLLVVVVISGGVDMCLIHEVLQCFLDLGPIELGLQSLADLHCMGHNKDHHNSLLCSIDKN